MSKTLPSSQSDASTATLPYFARREPIVFRGLDDPRGAERVEAEKSHYHQAGTPLP